MSLAVAFIGVSPQLQFTTSSSPHFHRLISHRHRQTCFRYRSCLLSSSNARCSRTFQACSTLDPVKNNSPSPVSSNNDVNNEIVSTWNLSQSMKQLPLILYDDICTAMLTTFTPGGVAWRFVLSVALCVPMTLLFFPGSTIGLSLPEKVVASDLIVQDTWANVERGNQIFSGLHLFSAQSSGTYAAVGLGIPGTEREIPVAQAVKGWKPSELPSPQNDRSGICGRNGLKSSMCDPDGILSLNERNTLDGFINFIGKGTNGFKVSRCGDREEGHQVAVLVVKRMDSEFYRNLDDSDRAKRFAKDIQKSWGVGDAQCQNGIVVFVSIEDKQIYISTGKGARMTLTDSRVRDVLALMRPLMREQQYGTALIAAVQRIGKVVSGTDSFEDWSESGDVGGILGLILVSTWVITVSVLVDNVRRPEQRNFDRCKAALKRIDDDTAMARSGTYKTRSCPICLEEFEISEKKQAGSGKFFKRNEKKIDSRVTFSCGHQFHESCLKGWVQGGNDRSLNECPVCKKRAGSKEVAVYSYDDCRDAFEEERRFRISRARRIYPNYVSDSMVEDFQEDQNITLADHADFVSLNPALLANAESDGAGGSSSSFGGGSSDGGGGGGSSW